MREQLRASLPFIGFKKAGHGLGPVTRAQQPAQQHRILKGRVHPLAGEGQQRMGRISGQHKIAAAPTGQGVRIHRVPEMDLAEIGGVDHLEHGVRKGLKVGAQKGLDLLLSGREEALGVELDEPDQVAVAQGNQASAEAALGIEHLEKAGSQLGVKPGQVHAGHDFLHPAGSLSPEGPHFLAALGSHPIGGEKDIGPVPQAVAESGVPCQAVLAALIWLNHSLERRKKRKGASAAIRLRHNFAIICRLFITFILLMAGSMTLS